MNEGPYHDQHSLEEKAEELGKRAMALGLIPGFVIHFFPDVWEFYVPDEKADPLTPEEVFHQLRQLVEDSGK